MHSQESFPEKEKSNSLLYLKKAFFFSFSFWPHSFQFLNSGPGIEPMPQQVESAGL